MSQLRSLGGLLCPGIRRAARSLCWRRCPRPGLLVWLVCSAGLQCQSSLPIAGEGVLISAVSIWGSRVCIVAGAGIERCSASPTQVGRTNGPCHDVKAVPWEGPWWRVGTPPSFGKRFQGYAVAPSLPVSKLWLFGHWGGEAWGLNWGGTVCLLYLGAYGQYLTLGIYCSGLCRSAHVCEDHLTRR